MASAAANESALARNLLNSVLALAFPEHLATDAAAQQLFLAQVPQLRRILLQQNVFGVVDEGKALEKFQSKLFQLLDQPPAVLDKRVRAAAFALQLIVVQQCALAQLEQLTPKLMERVIKTVKYQQDAESNPALAPALDVAAVVVRSIELLSPEVRRELYDSFTKFLPSVLSQMQALGAKKELARSDVQLWASGVRLFIELLEASPNALRIYASKIEHVCALPFQFPLAFTSGDGDSTGSDSHDSDSSASTIGATCIGLLAAASDKTPQLWKQLVERAVEVVHLQVDLLSGKSSASSSSSSSASTVSASAAGGVRGWVKDATAASDALLSVYQRAELLLQRLELAVAALRALLASRSVSEREVQLVLSDVLALARRALAVRASEIGKQTAVSDDGVRLPASVVYGVLPCVQTLALRLLAAAVDRAGVCALRHASAVARVLRLASESAGRDAHAALFDAIGVCVRALGASTVEKLGVPLLEDMVARCTSELVPVSAVQQQLEGAAAAVADKSSSGGRSGAGKGKKRKRQAESGVAQLAETANTMPFVPRHTQRLQARTVDAALAAIATCVSVYGAVLPAATRAAASELARVAVQQRTKHKFLTSAAAVAAASAVSSSSTGGVDAVALLLLSDAVSGDASGAHGAHVVASMQYWKERARHTAVLAGASPLSTTLQLVALSAGDALLHPRAPPLAIALPEAADANAVKQQQQQLLSGFTTKSSATAAVGARASGSAVAGVRGRNDWNDAPVVEDADAEMADADAEQEEQLEEDSDDAVANGDDVADDAEEVDEADEDDDEDERPSAEAQEEEDDDASDGVSAAKVVTVAASDDDDDDEFPDIVVDDEDDE